MSGRPRPLEWQEEIAVSDNQVIIPVFKGHYAKIQKLRIFALDKFQRGGCNDIHRRIVTEQRP